MLQVVWSAPILDIPTLHSTDYRNKQHKSYKRSNPQGGSEEFLQLPGTATKFYKIDNSLNLWNRTCTEVEFSNLQRTISGRTQCMRTHGGLVRDSTDSSITYSEFCMLACTRTLSHSSLVSFPSVSLLTALRYCFLISELLFSSFFLLFIKNQLIATSVSLP